MLPERDRSLAERWQTPEFRHDLRAWCEAIVGPVTAMTQQKLRGWATVWRVETARGVWFAKQNCPGQQVEVALMAILARLVPDRVVPVTAAGDGFLLTPDQGEVFSETAGDRPGQLDAPGPRGCRAAARRAAPLRRPAGSGSTELSLDRSHDYVGARIEQYAGLPDGDPRRLAEEVADRLRAHLPVVRRWVEQVAALGLPLTLNHNDLHENNVFDVDGRLRFFDFGDALVTEPLGVLLVPLNVLAAKLGAGGDDPRLWAWPRPRWRCGATWCRCQSSARRCPRPPARSARPGRVVGALPAVVVGRGARASGGRSPRPGSARSC